MTATHYGADTRWAKKWLVMVVALAVLASCTAWAADAASPNQAATIGAKVFAAHCSSCHDGNDPHIPRRAQLAQLSYSDALATLTYGMMATHRQGLSTEEIAAVAAYVAGKGPRKGPAANANLCKTPSAPLDLAAAQWNGWGVDKVNSRYQPDPGFTVNDLARLKVKWAFSYPGPTVYGQPTIVGGRLFLTSATGRIYALDAKTGCTIWTYEAGAGSRTAITIGPAHGIAGVKAIAYLGDESATVHALDADTGRLLWKVKVSKHAFAIVTGAPKLYDGRLYVPVSSYEETGTAPNYPCCTFRGSVAALDAMTGKIYWQSYTITEPAHPTRKNEAGTQLFGPAGAAVWSSPTIDAAKGRLYVATGNSYTGAITDRDDAVIAMDLANGKILWLRQVTPDDNFIVGCTQATAGKVNCPVTTGPDYDFGSSPILRTLPDGKRILIAGQKSAVVYGLDPDADGKVLWQQKVGVGGSLGGIEWGMAADSNYVYAATSDIFFSPKPGGLTAIDFATGKTVWSVQPNPVCAWGKTDCIGAQSQAVTAMPGAVFSGSVDGHLRVYSAHDGRILWDFDTGRKFPAVNAKAAQGGSLNLGGPTIAGGMLFVNSGYGRFAGRNGYLLLAFSIDGE